MQEKTESTEVEKECKREKERVRKWRRSVREKCREYGSGEGVQERKGESSEVKKECKRDMKRVLKWGKSAREKSGENVYILYSGIGVGV